MNLNCSKGHLDQKVKFLTCGIVRHWRRLRGVLIESVTAGFSEQTRKTPVKNCLLLIDSALEQKDRLDSY